MEICHSYVDKSCVRIDGDVEKLEGRYTFKNFFILAYLPFSGSFGEKGFRIYKKDNYPNKFTLEVNEFDGKKIEARFDLLLLGRGSLVWQEFEVCAEKVGTRIEVCLTAVWGGYEVVTESNRLQMVRDFLAIDGSVKWVEYQQAEKYFNHAPFIKDGLEDALARLVEIERKIQEFASRYSFFVRIIPFIRKFLKEISDLTTPG